MEASVRTINLGGVNCYLAQGGDGFILVDTGFSPRRASLLRALQSAGCRPGNLHLVLITHGDSDHAGNAAYLQREYHAKVGMHPDDVGMVERGDMSWNRKAKADKMSPIMKVMGSLVRLGAKSNFETFTPDVAVTDGFDLSSYGWNAMVLHIPGHSKGSIGILTTGGSLYCGDFLYTTPGMNFVDDMAAREASLSRLKRLTIKTILPGHGKPTALLR